MIAITAYEVTELGLTLPNACIEIKEVNSAKQAYYQSQAPEGEPVMNNTIVRYKVWVSEEAYLQGKNPVSQGEKYVNFTPANQDVLDNIALDLAFPTSTIK